MRNPFAGGRAKDRRPKTQQFTRKKLHKVKEIKREEHEELVKARRADARKQAGPIRDEDGEVLHPGRRRIDRIMEGVSEV